MGSKIISAFLVSCLTASLLSGCGKPEEVPVIRLSVWTSEYTTDYMTETIEAFNREHSDEVRLDCTVSVQSESTCKSIVLASPEKAADLYFFADDQTNELINAGALLQNTYDADRIIEESGGSSSAVADVITRDGNVYAYPMTSGNGYYLYYNKKYFTDSDVKSLDRILEVAEKNEKLFSMDITQGWYLYSFFKGAGLELVSRDNCITNECNWNAKDTKYTGLAVTESILDLAKRRGFTSASEESFIEGVKNGTIIAGVNGPWNTENISSAWRDDFAAVKLPTFTLSGDQVQMYSFCGFKFLGINAHTQNPEWCMKLASYITNAENQLRLFSVTGECPVNAKAAADSSVQKSPSVAALSQQSEFSTTQYVADSFWDASNRFGITIAGGNQNGRDLQELLDEMTEQITAKPE